MLFLFGFPCRRDMIGQAGSHMVVVKESCSVVWTDSLQSCCSTPRCLYFFYFWRLTSAEGKQKGQRIIVPISTPVTKCFGFYRRPWGHGSGGSSGPPSVTYVGKQPLPRLQCSNSLPSRSKQNLLRVASVKSTFLAEKIPSEMEGRGDLAKWLQCYKGAVQEMITMYRESGRAKLGISSLHTNNVLLFMRVKMGKHWEVKWLQKDSADPKVWQTTRQTWAGDMWLACQKFPVQRYILYRNFNAVRWYFLENSMGTLNTSLSESFLLMSALSPL